MASLFRNFRLHWHRLTLTRQVTLAGVRLWTGDDVPKFVRSTIFKRTYERPEQVLLQQIARPGDRVLEIGAGIGFIGLLAARLVGTTGRVVSYEANPALKPLIERNHELNHLTPELRLRAITTDGSPVTFHTSENVVSSSLYARDEAQTALTVDADALDAVTHELRPNLIVMDVEGAEIDLLADSALEGVRALLVELHPHIVGQGRIDDLLRDLDARGFSVTQRLDKNVLLNRASYR